MDILSVSWGTIFWTTIAFVIVLLKEARVERDALMKDARETKEQIIVEAKERATVEYEKIVASAKETIQAETAAAVSELKKQVADLSMNIAEHLIREELKTDERQQQIIAKYLQEAKLN